MKRRAFLSLAATTGLSTLWPNSLSPNAPEIITSDKVRPAAPFGAQCGDVTANRAVIWSRSDRAARMIVEYSTTESFKNAQRVTGPAAIEPTDLTARMAKSFSALIYRHRGDYFAHTPDEAFASHNFDCGFSDCLLRNGRRG